ncbi:MAG TPA: hypothetical protein VMU19_12640, partial [Bryobacteraceae bacterium]|nr:hypothetical protein [Bryobacteraceae bacterium]
LRASWSADLPIDVATCYGSLPAGFDPAATRLYRLNECRGAAARLRLMREMAARPYSHVGIVCSAEPILARWKWMLALRLPAKVFIINENGDFFWVDRSHLSSVRRFAVARAGLAGMGAVRTPARLIALPFTLAALALYAAAVHARRLTRLAVWRVFGSPWRPDNPDRAA